MHRTMIVALAALAMVAGCRRPDEQPAVQPVAVPSVEGMYLGAGAEAARGLCASRGMALAGVAFAFDVGQQRPTRLRALCVGNGPPVDTGDVPLI